jgi:hypothetical protein
VNRDLDRSAVRRAIDHPATRCLMSCLLTTLARHVGTAPTARDDAGRTIEATVRAALSGPRDRG